MTDHLRSIELQGDTIIMRGWVGAPVVRECSLSEYNRVVRAFVIGQISEPDDIDWQAPWKGAEWLFQ